MVTRRFAASVVVGMLSTLLLVAVAPTAVADSLSTVNRAVLPPGALAKNQSATLNAVSCAAVNTCTAVGAYRTSNGPAPLVSTEVGGVWQSPTTVVLPSSAVASSSGRGTTLFAVACSRGGACVAVGTVATATGNQPLLIVEKRGVWSSAVTPPLPANARTSDQVAALLGVSCNGAGNCAAVGTYVTAANNVEPWTMSERSGTWFAPVVPALPTGALTILQDASLNAVACHSVGNCTAVGSFVDANDTQPMALLESHGTWGPASSAVTITLPADAAATGNDSFNGLNSVACPGAASCVAVGQYATTTGYAAFTVGQSSGQWSSGTAMVTPPPLGGGAPIADLQSVSCTSSTTCATVGASGTTSESFPVVGVMTNGTWSDGTASPTPVGKSAVAGQLSQALSVVSFAPGQNLIVGHYVTNSGTQGYTSTPTTFADPPPQVTVVAHNGAAYVSWLAPTYTGGVPLTGFAVTVTPGSFGCTTASALHCTVTNLVNGTTYRVTVTAFNNVGASRASSVVTVTPATVPSAPTITAVHALAGGFQLLLASPASNGGARVQTYEYSLDGGAHWHHRATGTTSRILTITALQSRHVYHLAVRAVNRAGNGAPSPVVRAVTH